MTRETWKPEGTWLTIRSTRDLPVFGLGVGVGLGVKVVKLLVSAEGMIMGVETGILAGIETRRI